MKQGRIWLILAALAIVMPGAAFGAPVGSFTKLQGGVDILRTGARVPEAVIVGDQVSAGDIVRTKRNGAAEIRFVDDTTVQLAPETRMKIEDYTVGQDNVRTSGLLNLLRGKIRALVSKARTEATPAAAGRSSASTFNIKTRTAIAGVKGTGLIVYYNRGVTGVIFFNGHGFVYNPHVPDRIVTVTRGHATFVANQTSPPGEVREVSSDRMEAAFNRSLRSQAGRESSPSGVSLTVDQLSSLDLSGLEPGFMPVGTSEQWPSIAIERLEDNTRLVPITETDTSLVATPVTLHVTIPK